MRPKRPVPNELCARIEDVRRRLEDHYGIPVLQPNEDPIAELISTILSQNTTDTTSWRAYLELRRRYPTWEEVLAAPMDDVADAIRVSGLSMQKARTIQTALAELEHVPLDSLTSMPVAEARAWLTSIRGVGDKTASCVLLFALGMPAHPVDTHIQRVTTRLGITNGETTATGIQRVLEHCLPSDGQTMYSFHIDTIRHGREVCHARNPRCGMCVLNDICAYYAEVVAATHGPAPSSPTAPVDR